MGERPEAVLGRYRRTPGEPTGLLLGGGTTRGAWHELVAFVPACKPTAAGSCDPAPACADPTKALFGRYRAPVGEFFLPENRVPGDPRPPVDVECMSFLLFGGEMVTDPDVGTVTTGRLAPWPGRYPGTTRPICAAFDMPGPTGGVFVP